MKAKAVCRALSRFGNKATITIAVMMMSLKDEKKLKGLIPLLLQ